MLRPVLLSLIAGYTDAVGYIDFNAFAGLRTGNTIFLGIEVAASTYDRAFLHALVIHSARAAFGSRGSPSVDGSHDNRNGAAYNLQFRQRRHWSSPPSSRHGLQNSAANGFNGMALNQVFITGSLQKLGDEIVHRPWPTEGAVSHGLRIFAGVWLGYAIDALVGALASTRLGAPLLLPRRSCHSG